MNLNFYQLNGANQAAIDEALPKLLEKALSVGTVALVVSNTLTAERLNERLWTAEPESFLPHQLFADKEALGPGVTIFTRDEFGTQSSQISPEIVVNINGALAEYHALTVVKLLDIFTSDESSVQAARGRWKAHDSMGRAYFAQAEDGKWQKKA